MFTVKKILVPTDFSENASIAYQPARQIASRYGAKIDFIHIIPTFHYFNESMTDLGVPLSMEKDVYPRIQEQASGRMNELMDDYIEPEYRGEGVVVIAPKTPRAISDYAWKGGYDMIVMAVNGRHESEFLRGSITEKVIRYSITPVLTTDSSDLEGMENVLVPTDGSPTSLKALPLALSLALTFDAGITLFHVLELHGSLTENAPKNPLKSNVENIRDVIFSALKEFFTHSWDKLKLRKGEGDESQLVYSEGASNATIRLKTVIEKGVSAHYAITNYAEEHADMVVMTTHGRSGLAHLFLGSTAEKVAQHLALPVLTVKPDFDEITQP